MGLSLVSVEVRNGDINKAIKILKKKVEESNHLNELRERQYFLKPSVIKRRQMNKVKYKLKKERLLNQ